jgi:predicted phosphoadenosine phosphosulfate sulfurtransferase
MLDIQARYESAFQRWFKAKGEMIASDRAWHLANQPVDLEKWRAEILPIVDRTAVLYQQLQIARLEISQALRPQPWPAQLTTLDKEARFFALFGAAHYLAWRQQGKPKCFTLGTA